MLTAQAEAEPPERASNGIALSRVLRFFRTKRLRRFVMPSCGYGVDPADIFP
jgi:hypothetical protein